MVPSLSSSFYYPFGWNVPTMFREAHVSSPLQTKAFCWRHSGLLSTSAENSAPSSSGPSGCSDSGGVALVLTRDYKPQPAARGYLPAAKRKGDAVRSFTIYHRVHSERNLGLRITRPPLRPSSQRVVEHLEVLDREDPLTHLQGWEDQQLTFQAAIQGPDLAGYYRQDAAALMGAKALEMSMLTGVFYQVRTVMVGALEQTLTTVAAFEVPVCLVLFAHLLKRPAMEFTKQVTLVNPGNAYAQPVIILEGTGTPTLTGGVQVFSVKSPTELLTIDSALRVCRVGTKAGIEAITLDYPVLATGSNKVKVSSGVAKATIWQNWRRL